MLSLSSRYPIAGPSRRLFAGLLAITASLAIGACGADDSFAPTEATPAPADEASVELTPSTAGASVNALSTTLQRIVFTSYRHRSVGRVQHGPARWEPRPSDHHTES